MTIKQTLPMFAAAVALPLVFALGCGDDGMQTSDTADTNETASGEEECDSEIEGTIESDTTWTCGHTLSGVVTVKNGAKLTVMPGVTIKGLNGSALVVAKGSQLIAEGTKEQPIVFTSALAEGSRARGDWGGIVLLGDAKNNLQTGSGIAEGLDAGNPDYAYGGGDDAYSCGSLKWVRVEYVGYELTKDNELNGVTFYSCGTGTTVDYLQVHMGKDDGIEMFGGNWSGKHVVVTGAQDDSIDCDQGYTGSLQHVALIQDPAAGNYAFELSNQADNLDAEPRTAPKFVNVTAIGTAAGGDIETQSAGVRLKEGVAAEFYNAIFLGFHGPVIELTEGATEAVAAAGGIKFMNSLFFGNSAVDDGATPYVVGEGSTFDLEGLIEDPANNNLIDTDPLLTGLDFTAPNIAPTDASPVRGAGAAPAGFDAADYIGAVANAEGDWTLDWTTYAAN
ncbi:hypothetical protein SAMN02745121_02509 [Nannocystis exedens]|uniref:Lipoprotein n=1 Tax=Nannocystis exedens TaxID=54 RepID=A0A1I1WV86_9BACT|nr:hypothetical protein [Nannocystis exedens]PCC71020.1 lipoprotein [Nannocystis exedens]SFD98278.1 hypothetical protein SAMN02745121_02509 [Nannocystis exedens]